VVDSTGSHRCDSSARHAWLLIGAGVCAALHVGKLPPALDVLRAEFGLGLGEAGLLLSMVQIAGMTAGVLFGAWIDAIGSSRSLRSGLAMLALASVAGAFSHTAAALLAWRAVEGVGLLLTVLAAPPWIRTLVTASRLQRLMGLWGTYMPFGIALGLVIGPAWIAAWGWRSWWAAVGVIAAAAAAVVAWQVPADRAKHRRVTTRATSHDTSHHTSRRRRAKDPPATASDAPAKHGARAQAPRGDASPRALLVLFARLRETLGHSGPWLVALCFAVYSSQWLAVVGFLPTVYAQLGLTPIAAGMLTAVVSVANAAGNMLGASLLHRGHRATRLIATGFAVMGAGSVAAYVHVDGAPLPLAVRYAAVLAFSLVGGLIPSSLFALSTRMAPSDRTLGSTVGWMQQWSAFGQFGGPPLAGWLAGVMGGWQFTWIVTAALSAAGLVLAAITARHPRVRPASVAAHPG
jgi:CP family cyanate transporter-like MFS transporter